MEGPTPVSALIHAATMVTAGVFVLIRLSYIFEYSVDILWFVVVLGALTSFFAGTIGIFQNDLKRVIAYSTCSQLGYMIFACGLSNYSVAIFHLMNHAFFKALLFLSAGSVIHALLDEQDMRKMGGLLHLMPYTFCMFVVGSLALMGFPFTTGFYSKDVILELAYSSYYIEGIFSYWLGVLGACCTAFYSYRLLYMTFLEEANFPKNKLKFVHDAPFLMSFPLFVLGLGSIFVGYIFKDMFIGFGTNFWGTSIYSYNNLGDLYILEAEYISSIIKFIPIFFSFFFGFVALITYNLFSKLLFMFIQNSSIARYFLKFFVKKWYFDVVYNNYIVKPVLYFGYVISFKGLDRGLFELMGPTGFVRFFGKLSKSLRLMQTGKLFHNIFINVLSFISFLLFMVLFVLSQKLFLVGMLVLFLFKLFDNISIKNKN